jgi:hypothetical protein
VPAWISSPASLHQPFPGIESVHQKLPVNYLIPLHQPFPGIESVHFRRTIDYIFIFCTNLSLGLNQYIGATRADFTEFLHQPFPGIESVHYPGQHSFWSHCCTNLSLGLNQYIFPPTHWLSHFWTQHRRKVENTSIGAQTG